MSSISTIILLSFVLTIIKSGQSSGEFIGMRKYTMFSEGSGESSGDDETENSDGMIDIDNESGLDYKETASVLGSEIPNKTHFLDTVAKEILEELRETRKEREELKSLVDVIVKSKDCQKHNGTSEKLGLSQPSLEKFKSWSAQNDQQNPENKLILSMLDFAREETENLDRMFIDLEHETRFLASKAKFNQLQELKNLSTTTARMLLKLAEHSKLLEQTYTDIGCSSNYTVVTKSRFCRNGKWFYPLIRDVGEVNDLSSENFRAMRLKLYGQIWSVKSSDANTASFKIQTSEIGKSELIRNIKDVIGTAASVGLSVNVNIIVNGEINYTAFNLFVRELGQNTEISCWNIEIPLPKEDRRSTCRSDVTKTINKLSHFIHVENKLALVSVSYSFPTNFWNDIPQKFRTPFELSKGCVLEEQYPLGVVDFLIVPDLINREQLDLSKEFRLLEFRLFISMPLIHRFTSYYNNNYSGNLDGIFKDGIFKDVIFKYVQGFHFVNEKNSGPEVLKQVRHIRQYTAAKEHPVSW